MNIDNIQLALDIILMTVNGFNGLRSFRLYSMGISIPQLMSASIMCIYIYIYDGMQKSFLKIYEISRSLVASMGLI